MTEAPEYRALKGALQIEMVGRQSFDNAVEMQVDDLWAAALAGNSALFDGAVCAVLDISGERLRVGEIFYRHVMAARMDRDLAKRMQVRTLAVSGVLRCRDGFVFGRRGEIVTGDNGLWELVPSGGASSIDLAGQILQELTEEVGLSAAQVAIEAASGLVVEEEVIDVVFPISTSFSAEEVVAAHAVCRSAEYAQLLVTPAPHAFIADRLDVSTTSRIILNNHHE